MIKKAGPSQTLPFLRINFDTAELADRDLTGALHWIFKRNRHLEDAIFVFRAGLAGIYRTAKGCGRHIVKILPRCGQAKAVIQQPKVDIFFLDARDADLKIQPLAIIVHIRAHIRGHLEFFVCHNCHLLYGETGNCEQFPS